MGNEPPHTHPASDPNNPLGASLEPLLVAACENRLKNISWFTSAWQAGGASTGQATFVTDDGVSHEVIVKLPVGPQEHRWTTAVGGVRDDGSRVCASTPRVLASGVALGSYDLAWIVEERLEPTPLSAHLDEHAPRELLTAAVHWYAAAGGARDIAQAEPPPPKDWEAVFVKGRDIVHKHGIAEEQRWNGAIRTVQRHLLELTTRWNERPITTWCHGDLHFGNALRRPGARPGDGCVLIDLALVHPGHWVEDAVYLERLYWAKPELLHGVKPVSEMARVMRERHMLHGEDYAMLANIRRVLMAASVPAFLTHEGHPKYVHAALEILEKLLPQVVR